VEPALTGVDVIAMRSCGVEVWSVSSEGRSPWLASEEDAHLAALLSFF